MLSKNWSALDLLLEKEKNKVKKEANIVGPYET